MLFPTKVAKIEFNERYFLTDRTKRTWHQLVTVIFISKRCFYIRDQLWRGWLRASASGEFLVGWFRALLNHCGRGFWKLQCRFLARRRFFDIFWSLIARRGRFWHPSNDFKGLMILWWLPRLDWNRKESESELRKFLSWQMLNCTSLILKVANNICQAYFFD